MSPKEYLTLRTALGLSNRQVAWLFGRTERSCERWASGQKVPEEAAMLLRLLGRGILTTEDLIQYRTAPSKLRAMPRTVTPRLRKRIARKANRVRWQQQD